MSPGDYRYVIAGSGFFGAVMAERISTVLGAPVLVVEKRDHFGGNSFSEQDSETGIEYHRYGTHLFHTSAKDVWSWIGRFTEFNNYRHRVLTRHDGRMYTMPINLMTLNNFFGVDLKPSEAAAFIAAKAAAEGFTDPQNFEEKGISLIGRELYEAFIRSYTAKQWETDPKLLPAETIKRLPVRFNYNDFYFNDIYEGLPLDGYHAIFQRIFAMDGIDVVCNCDFFDIRDQLHPEAQVIYTGPIDRYFDERLGVLGWRTLDFEIERPAVEDYQGASVVNYPDADVRFTRIHEFRHLHPERRYTPDRTLIMREYSRFAGRQDEPYYPINTPTDRDLYDAYAALAAGEQRVIFGGRLGTYRYLDMHQAIGAALKSFERELLPRVRGEIPDQAWHAPPSSPSLYCACLAPEQTASGGLDPAPGKSRDEGCLAEMGNLAAIGAASASWGGSVGWSPVSVPPALRHDRLAPTVFHQPWWLDAATGGDYREASVTESGRRIGWFPYVLDTVFAGHRFCGMPKLTHFLGPAIDDGQGAACNRVLRRAQITRELLAQVPHASGFWQKLHRDTQDTLVYQELGYTTSVQFTFEVAPAPAELLWRNMRDKTRNVIRRASEQLRVGTTSDASAFAGFYLANLQASGRTSHYSRALIERLCTAAIAHDQGRILYADDGTGEPCAAVFYVWDAQAAYYLMTTRTPEAGNGAVSQLVWHAMQEASLRGLIFDFEGVIDPGGALFFTGFGGVVAPRYVVSKFSLGHRVAGRLSNPFRRSGSGKYL